MVVPLSWQVTSETVYIFVSCVKMCVCSVLMCLCICSLHVCCCLLDVSLCLQSWCVFVFAVLMCLCVYSLDVSLCLQSLCVFVFAVLMCLCVCNLDVSLCLQSWCVFVFTVLMCLCRRWAPRWGPTEQCQHSSSCSRSHLPWSSSAWEGGTRTRKPLWLRARAARI